MNCLRTPSTDSVDWVQMSRGQPSKGLSLAASNCDCGKGAIFDLGAKGGNGVRYLDNKDMLIRLE